MEGINGIERNTNEDVLRIVKEKQTIIDMIGTRRWKIIGHALRHPEELNNIIIEVS